jgi:hypothetical protein
MRVERVTSFRTVSASRRKACLMSIAQWGVRHVSTTDPCAMPSERQLTAVINRTTSLRTLPDFRRTANRSPCCLPTTRVMAACMRNTNVLLARHCCFSPRGYPCFRNYDLEAAGASECNAPRSSRALHQQTFSGSQAGVPCSCDTRKIGTSPHLKKSRSMARETTPPILARPLACAS